MRLLLIAVALAAPAACTAPSATSPPSHSTGTASTTPTTATAAVAVPSPSTVAPTSTGEIAAPPTWTPVVGDDAGAAAPAASAARLPVAELPADLTVPAPPISDHGDDHDHDADDGEAAAPSPSDVATAWAIARHSTRFDDPADDRLGRLSALASHPTVAADADIAAPRADAASGGATWAIVTAVSDAGDGWWRVQFTLKRTQRGQVGPSSTPATLDVHVTAGRVDGERS